MDVSKGQCPCLLPIWSILYGFTVSRQPFWQFYQVSGTYKCFKYFQAIFSINVAGSIYKIMINLVLEEINITDDC